MAVYSNIMSEYGIEQAPAGPTAAGPGREADEAYRQQRSPYAADLDVAIIGGGIAGLATAVALRRLNPDWQIKVCHTLHPACSRHQHLLATTTSLAIYQYCGSEQQRLTKQLAETE